MPPVKRTSRSRRRKPRRHDDAQLLAWWRDVAREVPDMRLADLTKRDRGRFLAAVQRFGSWQAVSERAGVGSWPRMDKTPWTPQRVLDGMRGLAARGRPVSDDQNLYLAAIRHFGSLAEAARIAGVDVRQPRRRSAKEAIAALRDIARRHGTVTSELVAEAGMRSAVERHFGGLTAACSAAGVPGYRQAQARGRQERYARDPALASLRRVAAAIKRPVKRRDISWPLHQALLRHFGSLREARAAAGLPQPAPRASKWSRDRVLAELRREHRRGTRLTGRGLVAAGRGDLASAIDTVIGSLRAARRLAGVPDPRRPPPPRRPFTRVWDEDLIIEEIRAWAAAGNSLAYSRAPSPLTHAGANYMGSWRAAVEAAGFDYDAERLRRDYTDDDLITLLRRLHAARPELTLGELKGMQIETTLGRHFGSIQAAVARAGLTDWPVRAAHPVLSRSAVRAALRARLEAGLSVRRRAVEEEDPPLAFSVIRVHPVWPEALARIGIRPPAIDRYWDRERVASALATRARSGRSLSDPRVRADDAELHEAAVRWFGSLAAAVAAAGTAKRMRGSTRRRSGA